MKVDIPSLPKTLKDIKALSLASDSEELTFTAGAFRRYLAVRHSLLDGGSDFREDFVHWLAKINEGKQRGYKPLKKYYQSYRARRKDGFTQQDMLLVLKKSKEDEHHVKTKFLYLTPDFLSRPAIVDRYLNTEDKAKTKFNPTAKFNE